MARLGRLESILIAGIVVIIAVVLYNFVGYIPIRDYSLDVDALKDPESLLVNSRVVLKNTGKQPLNDINILYDGNSRHSEKLNILNAGQTVILSPPVGTELESVQVKSKEGIDVTKQFRTPTKMPGMIGS
ncbi:MAG: hypothetical protein M3162_04705 [Thermoproteota archaeon]|nr:hypothetical protein [Thermoproteota archaeon]